MLCDEVGRTSEPHVWALGDVASWRDAAGHQVRVEHWSNVADQARSWWRHARTGRALTVVVPISGATSTTSRSSAWANRPQKTGCISWRTTAASSWPYYERDGVLVAVVGGGMPGKVMKARAKIASRAPISEVLGSS